MRVKGDLNPEVRFSLEEQPNNPGFMLARFYENAQPYEVTEDDRTMSGYEYDEYHLELAQRDGLEADIEANYDAYLAQAKLEEAEKKTIPDLQAQVATLTDENVALNAKAASAEDQLTSLQLALCDVYELTMGGMV